jgi:hypothetical protein
MVYGLWVKQLRTKLIVPTVQVNHSLSELNYLLNEMNQCTIYDVRWATVSAEALAKVDGKVRGLMFEV